MGQKKWKRLFCVVPVILLLVGLLFWKGNLKQEIKYSKQYLDVFDTVTVITGYAKSEKEFNEQVKELHEQLVYYHKLFDIYHTYKGMNNMMTINETCPSKQLQVDQEMIDFLNYCKQMNLETNSQTNIALGSVLNIWHQHREDGLKDPQKASLPKIEDLKAASSHTNLNHLILDEKERLVSFSDDQLRLDVGGIAKGYGVEKVAQYAEKKGWDHFLLNVGGNIRAVGAKPDSSKWTIGIQDPFGKVEGDYIRSVQIANTSVVTSGNYQRFYVVNGKKYCHIIDPETLFPANYAAAVTVQCKNSGKADAYSTALFNTSIEEGKKIVEDDPDLEAFWITVDGDVIVSDGFGE